MYRFLVLCLFGFGCEHDVKVNPDDQSNEVFCIPEDTGTDELCCPEFHENDSECWVEDIDTPT